MRKLLPTTNCQLRTGVVQQRQAFSLLEVLVAMGLLMLLTLFLVEVSKEVSCFWQHAVQRQEACREGSAALAMISSDLRSAVFLSGTNNLSQNGFFLETTSCGAKESDRFFFLAALPREKRPAKDRGNVSAVGYFIGSQKSDSGVESHHLYRFYASCDETLEALTHGMLLDLYNRASPTNSSHCERIASNILEFQVTPLWCDHKYFSTNSPTTGGGINPPTLVEVRITAASSSMKAQNAKKNEEETFSTVVALPITR